MQGDLFSTDGATSQQLTLKDGDLLHVAHFYAAAEADALFQRLRNTIPWQQDALKMYGKTHKLPRLTYWMGDADLAYSYSGIRMVAEGWSDWVNEIKEKIEKQAAVKFNSCLFNYYRNGQDGMGWHQDNESALGENPVIASLTFGEARPFQLKHLYDKSVAKVSLQLKHGDLLIMRGSTQHFWQHQIPKTNKNIGERINLTFRKIL